MCVELAWHNLRQEQMQKFVAFKVRVLISEEFNQMTALQKNYWNSAIGSVAFMAIAITGSSLPSMAQTPAAASIIGQCRAAKQSTAIFSQRASTSAVVTALAAEQRVTLSENGGTDGFIGVSAPSKGFVQTVNLKPCANAPTPTPVPNNKGLCRRVSQTQGLIIRQGPNTTSNVVGGADFNSQVFLTTTPATSKVSSDGRIWVQIAKPIGGWVSNGFQNSPGTNLVFCQ
jgi:Bacterial SH3 domain